MKLYLLTLLVITSLSVNAQSDLYYENYDWEKEPLQKINLENFKEKDIIEFKDKTVNEFVFTPDDSFVEYSLVHKIYWLNSNDNIERFNKVYLPSSSSSEVIKNKARVITKEGNVIELDDSKILTSVDEETKRTLKYYALEGIEKGSFVEYYYVIKRYPTYTGSRVNLQSEIDKKNVSFELLSPSNLVFDFKSFNGLQEIKLDTTNPQKNHWKLQLDEIDGLQEEEQAPYGAELQFLVYKIDYNKNNPGNKIVSYRLGVQNIYKNLYLELNKKEISKLESFIKSIEGMDKNEPKKSIQYIENYIKRNIYIAEAEREDLDDISSIIQNKVSNERGIMKLYLNLFNFLDIDHQVVYTTNRSDMRFDKDFEAYNFLQEALIYFPKLKMYLSPVKLESRLGYPPGYLTDNYGLFIKQVTLGDFTSATGSIKYIEPVNYDKTNYDLVMNVNFDNEDLGITYLKMKRSMDGYYSIYVQPFFDFMNDEQKEEITDEIIKSIKPGVEIVNKEVLNTESNDFGNKPLIINADLKSEDFVENAGNKFLFKLGEIIGRQQEMYQEKKRILPVENDFERSYDRKIIVKIPEGYRFEGLEKINMDQSFEEDNEVLFMFKSEYEIVDDKLIVSIKEFYNKNVINVDLYEKYRTVINSAANFNKVTLILQKN